MCLTSAFLQLWGRSDSTEFIPEKSLVNSLILHIYTSWLKNVITAKKKCSIKFVNDSKFL